jgi:hypothetical protein
MPKPNDPAAELAALRAELAAAREETAKAKAAAAAGGKISYKVSEKGALSVYGLGRFPVTLYSSQWNRLLDPANVDGLRAFLVANEGRLTTKE